jgi:hypothetical protein
MSSASHTIPEVGTPFIILGADAVLAALPASPVQLAHACQALGFQLAAPATWGDELIAERCLEQLAGYEHLAAVMCSCPLVTERLTRTSTSLEPFMLTFTSPPVATARYLRAAFAGQTLHITYAGSCPGADDESIDARLRPSDLLDAFVKSGIVVGAQPNCFDALVPLDRRRFYSLPGGTPTRDQVERVTRRALIELPGEDVVLELSQQLIEQTPALIDLSVALGCACAGAGEHTLRGNARAGLLTLEPPRARQKVLDQSVHVDVSQTLVEACEVGRSAAEELAALEVHLAADVAHTDEAVVDIGTTMRADLVDLVAPIAVAAPIIAEAPVVESPPATAMHRRKVMMRAVTLPHFASADGELVPRASLAVLRRAFARNATRNARRQPKIERGRQRSAELREGLGRSVSRTPRSVAIPPAEPPRPVPPPPARHRPRSMLGLGL